MFKNNKNPKALETLIAINYKLDSICTRLDDVDDRLESFSAVLFENDNSFKEIIHKNVYDIIQLQAESEKRNKFITGLASAVFVSLLTAILPFILPRLMFDPTKVTTQLSSSQVVSRSNQENVDQRFLPSRTI